MWHRRYNRILKAMRDYGRPMTITMIMKESGHNREKEKGKRDKALVLHFRDWAKNTGRIVSIEGTNPILYQLTPPPNDSQ